MAETPARLRGDDLTKAIAELDSYVSGFASQLPAAAHKSYANKINFCKDRIKGASNIRLDEVVHGKTGREIVMGWLQNDYSSLKQVLSDQASLDATSASEGAYQVIRRIGDMVGTPVEKGALENYNQSQSSRTDRTGFKKA